MSLRVAAPQPQKTKMVVQQPNYEGLTVEEITTKKDQAVELINQKNEIFKKYSQASQNLDLDKNSLNELKNFAAHPEAVKLVMDLVMTTLDGPEAQHIWKANSIKLRNTLTHYDFSQVTVKMIRKVRTGIEDSGMSVASVMKVSMAAGMLFGWLVDWLEAAKASS